MPRTKEQNSVIREKTRMKIINSSMKLFAKKGFEGASVTAIAKDAKIAKGLIYNHFVTKEDIVKGIVDMLMEMGEEMMAPKIEFESASHHLKYVIDNFFLVLEQQSEMLRWMLPLSFQIDRFPFVTEIIAQKTTDVINLSATIFKKMGFEDPVSEAWFFGAISDGITMDQLLAPKYNSEKMHQYLLSKYKLENL